MKKDLSLWQFASFVFIVFLGTLLHFLYDFSGQNTVAALVSGVNESTWEHMKLLYFPHLAFSFIQHKFFKEYGNFRCIKLRGILLGLILIPVIFYTYNGVFGKSPDFVNIAIFFVSAALMCFSEWKLFKKDKMDCNCNSNCKYPSICLLIMILIGVLFIVFTFYVPKIPLFKDPVTGAYGIE